MIEKFKPLLATPVDFSKQRYPTLLSPKYDGIRAIIRDSFAMTRSLKLIPNKYVQQCIGDYSLEGFDGELCVGEPFDKNVYQATNSGVMSKDGEPDFKFYVFDLVPDDLRTPYNERADMLTGRISGLDAEFKQRIVHVPQLYCYNEEEVIAEEEQVLDLGYEGVMLRSPAGVYKLGRATPNGQELNKVKRFTDSEARIIGFECLMRNGNEATKDALGHTERSSHKANLIPTELLGNLLVEDIYSGVRFSIGTGFSLAQRQAFWANKDNLIGKLVKYKSFAIGVVDKPRFPVFLGFRDPKDLA